MKNWNIYSMNLPFRVLMNNSLSRETMIVKLMNMLVCMYIFYVSTDAMWVAEWWTNKWLWDSTKTLTVWMVDYDYWSGVVLESFKEH